MNRSPTDLLLRLLAAVSVVTALTSCGGPHGTAPIVDIKEGMERSEVVEQLGQPSGAMGHGSYEMLSYEAASIELENGVVTGVRIYTAAEMESRKKLAVAPKKKQPPAPAKRIRSAAAPAKNSSPARASGGGSGRSGYYQTSAKAHSVLDKARKINQEKAREMNR